MFHRKSKHIDTQYHFIGECVERVDILVRHVSTLEQRSEILTKLLGKVKFEEMRTKQGVKNILIKKENVGLIQ